MTNPDLQATLELLESISLKMPEASLTKIAIDNAITLLKAQQWISVEDELPEDDELVLAYDQNAEGWIGTAREGGPLFNGSDMAGNPLISHWMPLPAPPQNTTGVENE